MKFKPEINVLYIIIEDIVNNNLLIYKIICPNNSDFTYVWFVFQNYGKHSCYLRKAAKTRWQLGTWGRCCDVWDGTCPNLNWKRPNTS